MFIMLITTLIVAAKLDDPAQVWAQVHHNRPIPDHLLQAALKALDVAPDKIEAVPRISSVLMET